MNLKQILAAIIALLFGGAGVYMVTNAAPTYASPSVELDQKMYAWNIQTSGGIVDAWAQENHTIALVEHGTTNVTGDWTACTRNTTNWERWYCGDYIEGQSFYVRITQNDYPGTSYYTFNLTIPTYTYPTTFCGSEECTYTGGTIAAGTYYARKITFSAGSTTIAGNVTLVAWEGITINSGATISVNPSNPAYTLTFSTFNFSNSGTISGYGAYGGDGGCGYSMGDCGYGYGPEYAYCDTGGIGGNGPNYIFNVANFVNTASGYIITNGGAGGSSCGFVAMCNICSGTGGKGGSGGTVTFNMTTSFNNSGAINMLGNIGGNGPCYWLYSGVGGAGGNGGNLTNTFFIFSNTGTISTNGANPGSGCSAYLGGNGGKNALNISTNITVTNYMTAAAGSTGTSGTWDVTYNANGSGMDWSKIIPTPTTIIGPLGVKPTPTFRTPNVTSNYVPSVQNITVNITNYTSEMTYVVQYSRDNGTTWYTLTENYTRAFPPAFNNSTILIYSHSEGTTPANMHLLRMLAYNSTSKITSDWIYSSNFNVTPIATTTIGYASPNGTVSTTAVTFYCNYTNTTPYPLSNPTIRVEVDGVQYDTTFDSGTKLWYYVNNNTWVAGNHTWRCVASRVDFASSNMTNVSFLLSGFAMLLPSGYTSAKIVCPFPTIANRVPSGQSPAVGIFNVRNYNDSALNNYTIWLNTSAPAGMSVYARCDRFTTVSAGWTLLSTTAGYQCIKALNSTNTSAYIWLKADCVSVAAGTYPSFDYIFTEN